MELFRTETSETSETSGTSSAPQSYRFDYHGEGGELLLLLLKNVFLTLITFGIYAAWAKADRRRYIWSNIDFHGQRLTFTGTGGELFVGYLKVVAVYIVLFVPAAIAGAMHEKNLQLVLQVLSGVGLFLLLPYAIYRSRAYILSRTLWRGIRLGLAGTVGPYARTFIVGGLLSIVTLGLYSPWLSCRLRKIITDDTRLGSQPFSFDGNGRELFGIWIKGLLLSIVTLGIYGFWMQAAVQRYMFQHTRVGDSRFRLTLTGGHLFKITVVHALGTTLTLGIAFPWITTWALRSILQTMSLEGQVDFDLIVQRGDLPSAAGDALADALDVGLGV